MLYNDIYIYTQFYEYIYIYISFDYFDELKLDSYHVEGT